MLKSLTKDSSRPVLDVVNIIAGIALVLSPWYLGYTAVAAAAWNAWVTGAIIALIAVGALVAFNEYEEWANLVVGLWIIAAPWVLGFSAVTAAMWAHVVAGIVIALLAAGGVWFVRNRPLSTA
jgi:hypothetical protein